MPNLTSTHSKIANAPEGITGFYYGELGLSFPGLPKKPTASMGLDQIDEFWVTGLGDNKSAICYTGQYNRTNRLRDAVHDVMHHIKTQATDLVIIEEILGAIFYPDEHNRDVFYKRVNLIPNSFFSKTYRDDVINIVLNDIKRYHIAEAKDKKDIDKLIDYLESNKKDIESVKRALNQKVASYDAMDMER